MLILLGWLDPERDASGFSGIRPVLGRGILAPFRTLACSAEFRFELFDSVLVRHPLGGGNRWGLRIIRFDLLQLADRLVEPVQSQLFRRRKLATPWSDAPGRFFLLLRLSLGNAEQVRRAPL